MRIAATTALILVAAARIAAAAPPSLTTLSNPEDPPTRAAPLAEPAAAPSLPQQPDADWVGPPPVAKNESTATALAFGTTAAGWLLGFAAAGHNSQTAGDAALALIVVGPSAGHIYAGESLHAVGMTALRTAGLITFAVGLLGVVAPVGVEAGANCNPATDDCSTGDYRNAHSFATGAMIVGGTAFVVGTVYDLVDAHNAARRTNEKVLGSMTIAPTVIRVPNGMAPGMAFTGSF